MRRREFYGLLGERHPELDDVTLTESERLTLRKAAAILHQLRVLREELGLDDDETTDVALAAYTCEEWGK